MTTNQTLRTGLCLATFAFGSLAHADPATEQEIRDGLQRHAATLQVLREGVGTQAPADRTAASCTAVIDRARAAKIPAAFQVGVGDEYAGFPGAYQTDTRMWALRMSDAHHVCSELARWIPIADARKLLEQGAKSLAWLEDTNKSTNHSDNAPKLQASAKACVEGTDALTKAGVAQVKVSVEGSPKTIVVASAKATICDPLAKGAATFAEDVTSARKAEWEKAAKPYMAAGFKGDRLDFVVGNAGTAIFVAGGKEISGNLKAMKSAKVMFYRLTGSDGSVTLKRHEFRGDKLVKQSQTEHLRQPPAGAYR